MSYRNAEARLPPRRNSSTKADRKAVRSFWRGWIFGMATSAVLDILWTVFSRVLP